MREGGRKRGKGRGGREGGKEREGGRKRGKGGGDERGREGMGVYLCECVCENFACMYMRV